MLQRPAPVALVAAGEHALDVELVGAVADHHADRGADQGREIDGGIDLRLLLAAKGRVALGARETQIPLTCS